MQPLEVSGAVRLIYGSLGVKRLNHKETVFVSKETWRILGPLYDNKKENWRILTKKEIYASV